MEWDTVIGLEVHAQLSTQSKLFSGAATRFGAAPNTQACFIDAGFPGVLPVLNKKALIMAIQFGLAIDAEINPLSVFERKNYFYPDLPKGYQISQFQKPIVSHGQLSIPLSDGSNKQVAIVRAHLEEDAGKSLHDSLDPFTRIDLNRAGTPLLEIVTAPCLGSAEEAISYLKTLHQLVRFLGICDGSMEQGSFRCDVNLSLKPKGSQTLGIRTELKNLNSFRYIAQAILFEQSRHQELLETGQQIQQETRLYRPDSNTTHLMRRKEDEQDYRYFPDPDLLPIRLSQELIAEVRKTLPELPAHIQDQLRTKTDLHEEDIQFILSAPEIYRFFKDLSSKTKATKQSVINWIKGPYAAKLHETEKSFANPPIDATTLACLLDKLHHHDISSQQAKQIFQYLWAGEKDIETIIQREGYQNIDDQSQLEALVTQVIQHHPEQVAQYQGGKEKLLAFFVGQVMKETKGKANPEKISELFKKRVGQ